MIAVFRTRQVTRGRQYRAMDARWNEYEAQGIVGAQEAKVRPRVQVVNQESNEQQRSRQWCESEKKSEGMGRGAGRNEGEVSFIEAARGNDTGLG